MDDKTMEKYIEKYFSEYDFDIRKRRKKKQVPNFISQKSSPDLTYYIAKLILDWVQNRKHEWNITFNNEKGSLWHYPMFSEIMVNVYNKPNPMEFSRSEYDKVLQNTMVQFVYAEILSRKRIGRSYVYSIKNNEGKKILEFIGKSWENAFLFQGIFYDKVSKDSKFDKELKQYKKIDPVNYKNVKKQFKKLKVSFDKFLEKNTKIKNYKEKNRIFAKFLNNFAVKNKIRGTADGKPTKFIPNNLMQADVLTLLFYNKPNWYDDYLQKNKNVTRKEGKKLSEENYLAEKKLVSRIQKAKDTIKEMYRKSEHDDKWSNTGDYEAHHICKSSDYEKFADRIENIIYITGKQHSKAHTPAGKTKKNFAEPPELEYQKLLFISKSKSIEESIKKKEKKYDKEKFIEILNVGLNLKLKKNASFNTIRKKLS